MAEYIERTEELVLAVNAGARAIENTKRYHGATYCLDMFSDNQKEIPYLKAAQILRELDSIPAADVEEVKHGRWIEQSISGEQAWCCSECKTLGSPHWKRCPVCEAKMSGGEENG